jgi:hypothetical protein
LALLVGRAAPSSEARSSLPQVGTAVNDVFAVVLFLPQSGKG